jgi:hypothetical protein
MSRRFQAFRRAREARKLLAQGKLVSAQASRARCYTGADPFFRRNPLADDTIDVFLSPDRRAKAAEVPCGRHRPALRRDAPPSPWPAEGVVHRWERLYGTVAEVGAQARFRTGLVSLRSEGSFPGLLSLRNRRDHDNVPVETSPSMNDTLRRPRRRRGVSSQRRTHRTSRRPDLCTLATRLQPYPFPGDPPWRMTSSTSS